MPSTNITLRNTPKMGLYFRRLGRQFTVYLKPALLLTSCSANVPPVGYYECAHTPGLWQHITRPIQCLFVVDDFGVKYVGKEHVERLLKALKKDYKLTVDWEGEIYCGIKLD